MNSLKQLAGQTALYGASSVLGRFVNYLLVPIHTAIFLPESYGIVSELYAYMAILNVLYTYGMETAFFRFATKSNSDDAYNTAATCLVISSLVLSGTLYFYAPQLATWLGYSNQALVVRWISAILLVDAIVAIPFARLRIKNQPIRFVSGRLGSILINVLLNLLFLVAFPRIAEGTSLTNLQPLVEAIYNPSMGIGYIFLANLIANLSYFVILGPEFVRIRLSLNRSLLSPMLWYGFPIFVAGIAGIVNDQIDKILFNDLIPDSYYPDTTSQAALGIYGACFKLSVFMSLAIQSFRYAGEPFFFSRAQEKESPSLFAQTMHYFVLVGLVIFVGVSINIDLLGRLFLSQPEYREALFVVPLLLLGKLLFGVYLNLSIWFKLTDKTIYGVYISLIGAAITLGANIALVPILGYLGAGLACVLCYLSMTVLGYYWGRKRYPVPYNWRPLFAYLLASLILVYLSFQIDFQNFWFDSALNLLVLAVFIGVMVWIEKGRFIESSTGGRKHGYPDK